MWLDDLVTHKGYADAELLKAVQRHEPASSNLELRTLLHHVLVSNRFWLLSIAGEPFQPDVELRVPHSLDALIDGYRTSRNWSG